MAASDVIFSDKILAILGISETTLWRRRVVDGNPDGIPVYKHPISGRICASHSELTAWIERHTAKAREQQNWGKRDTSRRHTVRVIRHGRAVQ